MIISMIPKETGLRPLPFLLFKCVVPSTNLPRISSGLNSFSGSSQRFGFRGDWKTAERFQCAAGKAPQKRRGAVGAEKLASGGQPAGTTGEFRAEGRLELRQRKQPDFPALRVGNRQHLRHASHPFPKHPMPPRKAA